MAPLVYDELRRLAASYLSRERAGHTLQPTALVNEAFLRLVDQTQVTWQNRAHFLGVAAQAMRRILVDHARRKRAAKRGEGAIHVSFEMLGSVSGPSRDVALDDLDDALDDLARLEPRQARVVELRFFGGLSIEEAAQVMGTSPATTKRDWTVARAFLHRALVGD